MARADRPSQHRRRQARLCRPQPAAPGGAQHLGPGPAGQQPGTRWQQTRSLCSLGSRGCGNGQRGGRQAQLQGHADAPALCHPRPAGRQPPAIASARRLPGRPAGHRAAAGRSRFSRRLGLCANRAREYVEPERRRRHRPVAGQQHRRRYGQDSLAGGRRTAGLEEPGPAWANREARPRHRAARGSQGNQPGRFLRAPVHRRDRPHQPRPTGENTRPGGNTTRCGGGCTDESCSGAGHSRCHRASWPHDCSRASSAAARVWSSVTRRSRTAPSGRLPGRQGRPGRALRPAARGAPQSKPWRAAPFQSSFIARRQIAGQKPGAGTTTSRAVPGACNGVWRRCLNRR